MNYLQQSFPEAIETLAARVGMQVPRDKNPGQEQASDLYQLLKRVAKFYQMTLKLSGKQAIEYLKQRGVNEEISARYQIGYAPPEWQTLEFKFKSEKAQLIKTGMLIQKDDQRTYDRYRHRIIFPIHDRHGRIIGFGGRSLDKNQQPKYLNSPETPLFQKSRELYGLHQALQQDNTLPYIIIVEGYMDVIALAQHGILNVVATLGTATSSYHIQLLSKHTQQLMFCFDGDSAGRQAAWRALESTLPHLNAGIDANFIFLPEARDPDDLVREEGPAQFLDRFKTATSLNRFFFDTLMRDIDQQNMSGKSQLVHAVKPYLLKMGNGTYTQLMVTELARLTRIDEHRLNLILNDQLTLSEPSSKQTQITRTPIRIATAILLQNPQIYAQCAMQIQAAKLDQQQQILMMLIEHVIKHPTINTAMLVENWRNTPWFESLNKLAAWDHQVPPDALVTEFIDIVLFLAKQNRENEIHQLLTKSRQQNLSSNDRVRLQMLLQQRHSSVNKKNEP